MFHILIFVEPGDLVFIKSLFGVKITPRNKRRAVLLLKTEVDDCDPPCAEFLFNGRKLSLPQSDLILTKDCDLKPNGFYI